MPCQPDIETRSAKGGCALVQLNLACSVRKPCRKYTILREGCDPSVEWKEQGLFSRFLDWFSLYSGVGKQILLLALKTMPELLPHVAFRSTGYIPPTKAPDALETARIS